MSSTASIRRKRGCCCSTGGDRVLKSFAPALTDRAARELARLGVEMHFGVHVSDVRRDGVTVSSKDGGPPDRDYATRTVLWTAGVEAVPFARHAAEVLGAKTDRSGANLGRRRPLGARAFGGLRHR